MQRWKLGRLRAGDRSRSRTHRLAGVAVVAVSIAGAVALVAAQWAEVRAETHPPGLLPLLAATAAHLVANGILVQAWRRLLATAGVQVGFGPAAWAWAAGQLTRYAFVSGIQVGGRAVAARAHGVSLAAGAASTVVEIVWQLSLTAALALATAPWWLGAADQLAWLTLLGLLPAGVLVVGLVQPRLLVNAAIHVLDRIPRLGGRLSEPVRRFSLTRADTLAVTGVYTLNTVLRLVAFVTLFAAVGGDLAADVMRVVGAWALGQLAGRLAVFAPGGLGPQEAAAAIVLGPALGPSALALVALVRVVEITAELAGLGAARLLRGAANRAASSAGGCGG